MNLDHILVILHYVAWATANIGDEDLVQLETRFSGGTPSAKGQIPYLAIIEDKIGSVPYFGAIISKYSILTSGGITFKMSKNKEQFRVFVQRNVELTEGGKEVKVLDLITHDSFNSTVDLGIIRVQEISFSDYVKAIKPYPSSDSLNGTRIYVCGSSRSRREVSILFDRIFF